jgi:antitoxin ParD1/3/4
MPTRNVVLTDKQEIFVGELVSAGRYQNASEGNRTLTPFFK